MERYFEKIWSCEDFSLTKADPEIYRQAADRMGLPVERILFLDDNLNAVSTARRAGMQVCGVEDDSSREDREKIQATAHFYIEDFSQLPAIRW